MEREIELFFGKGCWQQRVVEKEPSILVKEQHIMVGFKIQLLISTVLVCIFFQS